MDRIRIVGGKPLKGAVKVGGAKNAALPLMAASLLTDEVLTLSNLPHLADITTMANLLSHHGVGINLNGDDAGDGHVGRVIELHGKNITDTTAPYDLVRKMRASVLVLGPLVARHGEAHVSLPGGCAIGTRPIDLHIQGLRQLGAEIELTEGYVHAHAPGGLRGAEIVFPTVTVTGTENLLMAASVAKGTTRLINAAREPEITDLAKCLIAMGAKIEGVGTGTLIVEGVDRLHAARHDIIPDRIEAGTLIMAAAATNGELDVEGAQIEHLKAVVRWLDGVGVSVAPSARGVLVKRKNGALRGVDLTTEPFPGFPTDLQAQSMALMTGAEGAAAITETIFENRFMHVPELTRMGADITVHNATAMVRGVKALKGAPVMATDLRASVSLVVAGLAARGETVLSRIYHLDRGYERLEEKLARCGAEIERIRG
ncbi:MAG: UDP-N-acetylglucosamine 1-carboxyvinyltransferase [Alphaproteobacteria bacterium]|nr:UDP-N-acetylglucosamine 1-carboxyvinyltransferase [Alphaproteobacteria bacterium]